MSQVPPDYTPGTDFSTIAATPILTTGLPGAQLDAEFAAIADTTNDTIARLSEIQRDDGQIRNGMVKIPTLASEVLSLLAATGANPRTWAPFESFYRGDLVSNPTEGKISVTGTLSPDVTGVFGPESIINNKPEYILPPGPSPSVYFANGRWLIDDGVNTKWRSANPEDVATPDLVAGGWQNLNGSTGSPVLTAADDSVAGTWICITDHISSLNFSDDLDRWAFIAAPPQEFNSMTVDSFTGTGAQTAFTLSVEPSDENNTLVFVAGVYQRKSTYSVSGTTLTFAVAPANAAAIEVVIGVSAETLSLAIDDGAVTTDKLANGAVTTEKIADGAITADKLASGAAVADESITAAKLQNNSVTVDKIAAGAVTEGKIASGAVSESKLGSAAVTAAKIASSAVTTPKINDGAVTAAKLGADAVETAKIKDANVTAAKLATDAVETVKIKNANVTFEKLDPTTLAAGLLTIGGVPKVNVRFAGTSIVGTATNVAAIVNTGTGLYRVDFTTPLANANYIPVAAIQGPRSGTTYRIIGIEGASDCTTTSCLISVRRVDTGNLAPFAGTEFVTLTIY